MNRIALITTVHDANGDSLKFFNKIKDKFKLVYNNVYITISDETSVDLKNQLLENDFNVKVIPKKGAANARREVLKFGLEGQEEFFHYCDFDRVLTWINNYYLELKEIVKDIHNHNYLILGRTKRAFDTHPIEWIETEKITNKIFFLETGLNADITAGSCSFSRECGKYIIDNSKCKMTDGEWPMIVYKTMNKRISYKAAEGLEYVEEINKGKEIEDKKQWVIRLKLAYIISDSIINF